MLTRYTLPVAAACICGDAAHRKLCGTLKLIPHECGTLVCVEIRGLPDSETGFFALHIHEGADCCGEGFSNTGSHYDPTAVPHPLHGGDLPPLLRCKSRAFLAVLTDRFCPKDVVGKTVVIHSRPDDFMTQPSGNAGTKIACGVIRWV